MKMRAETIWQELERQPVYKKGTIRRLYSPDALPEIYIGVRVPEKHRVLSIMLPVQLADQTTKHPAFRGIKVEKTEAEASGDKFSLDMVLTDHLLADVFGAVAENIISGIYNLQNSRQVIDTFFALLYKWQHLFEKVSPSGLSVEAQRGLYGELYMMRKLLSADLPGEVCVSSWTGGDRLVQDFQYGHWAVEVKTASGSNPQKIMISNERQLDGSSVEHLFLRLFLLEARLKSGETLADIVASVRNQFENDIQALIGFNLKLVEAGYRDIQAPLYADTGYHVRGNYLFHVRDGFPRLTEQQIPEGVGDVKYSVSLAACMPYETDESVMIKILKAG